MHTKLIQYKESQPLIRHCLVYSIYGKKAIYTSYKEKFVNFLTKDGKKSKAYKIFNKVALLVKKKRVNNEKQCLLYENHYDGIQEIKNMIFEINMIKRNKIGTQRVNHVNKKNNQLDKSVKKNKKIISFNDLIIQAIDNVKPNLEVRKVKIAGTTYLVPAIIPKKRQQALAIKWLIQSARSKKRGLLNSFANNLAIELVDASKKMGQARQKRDELHKLAEANRAYIRYRWW